MLLVGVHCRDRAPPSTSPGRSTGSTPTSTRRIASSSSSRRPRCRPTCVSCGRASTSSRGTTARRSTTRPRSMGCITARRSHAAQRHPCTDTRAIAHGGSAARARHTHTGLNRFTGALASLFGIGVVDATDILSALRPTGFADASADGLGGSEGDPYHGFDPDSHYPTIATRMCEACSGRFRDEGMQPRLLQT